MRMWPMLVGVLIAYGCAKEPTVKSPPAAPKPGTQAAKVVMIIGHQNFRDEELTEPRKLLEEAGYTVEVASSATSPARGMLGMSVSVDLLVRDVKVSDYAARVIALS